MKKELGLTRVSFKGPCIYLVRGVCVPDVELGSVGTAVNKRGPALLGMTFQFCRTDPDILSVIEKGITGCALSSEGEARGATRTRHGEK